MTGTPSSDEVVDRFHRLWYRRDAWTETSWLGVRVLKCPLDLWVYHDLLFRTRPDLIVETGTACGGSAYFLASMLDILGKGRIVTVDVGASSQRPEHPRITYVTGPSVDPEIVAAVHELAREAARVMVVLDSDHSMEHVLSELRAYSPLVDTGSYLIVEDTNVNGHPVMPQHGPGPMEAVERFLVDNPSFEVDPECERYMLTFNPRGYLRRVGP